MTDRARSQIAIASITPAPEPLTQAERTGRRAAFAASFQLCDEARAYVPHDDERGRVYAAQQGLADAWPIALTPCTNPRT